MRLSAVVHGPGPAKALRDKVGTGFSQRQCDDKTEESAAILIGSLARPVAVARREPMRILAPFILWLLLATFSPLGSLREDPIPARTILSFAPLPLDPDSPGRRALGRLDYLAGWQVTSNDPRFGGLSAIHIGADGVIAMSDTGSLIRFPLPGSAGAARIEKLPDGPGSGDMKSDRDAESLVVHGGRAWIGFERSNAVWRYRRGDWRADAWAAPPAMRRWRGNRGSEAMIRLPGGRFLVFSEGGGGVSPVLLFEGDPAARGTKTVAMRYRPPDGFRITDAALLPGGGIILLNRRITLFEGFSATISLVRAPDLKAGAILAGEEIAALGRPLTVDNLEALSVTREGGRTIVWIASDDNFNPLQRTLLLKFALRD